MIFAAGVAVFGAAGCGPPHAVSTIGRQSRQSRQSRPSADEPPKDPGAEASEEDKKAFQTAQKDYDAKLKAWQDKVKAWQDAALDQLFKALKVVEYNAKQKENSRTDVNLKAAQAIGEILGSPDLAKNRDAKEVEKLRSERAKQLMDVISSDFGKQTGNKEYQIAVGVLEATFAALGKTNEPKALDWLLKEYTHTRNGQFEEERLVAAHKAMVMFTTPAVVPGKKRHEIVSVMYTNYSAVEAGVIGGVRERGEGIGDVPDEVGCDQQTTEAEADPEPRVAQQAPGTGGDNQIDGEAGEEKHHRVFGVEAQTQGQSEENGGGPAAIAILYCNQRPQRHGPAGEQRHVRRDDAR